MIKIIADSSCELSKSEIDKYDIEILPMPIIDGDLEYLDGVTITPEEVYKNMRNGKFYKTSALVPFTFLNKFKELSKDYDEIIYLGFSSGLSGTFNSAERARDEFLKENSNIRIELVDTKTTSISYKLMVLAALEMLNNGKSVDEIVKEVNKRVKFTKSIFTVDDINYLYHGGRVSRTQAFIGGMLNIKPILHTTVEGKLEAIDKARGSNRAYHKIIEIIKREMNDDSIKDQVVGISHADNKKGLEKIKELLESELGVKKFVLSELAPVIGCHTGPGLLNIGFYNQSI